MRAAVLGHPIGHSLSPALHSAAYRACGLTDWRYDSFDVAADGLAGFLAGLEGADWAGLSLTRPLKQVALALVDHLEPLAAAVGAVNTVLFSPGGLVGVNTDVYGMVQAIASACGGPGIAWSGVASSAGDPEPAGSAQGTCPAAPGDGVILGGGATAASALAAMGQLGVSAPRTYVRSLSRSAELIKAAGRMGVVPQFRAWPSRSDLDGRPCPAGSDAGAAGCQVSSGADWAQTSLLISTLPAGAADPLACDLAGLDLGGQVLLDVAYHPWPTALARAWTAGGGLVASGLDMLLFQAAEQFRLMTGRPAPLPAMRAALAAASAAAT